MASITTVLFRAIIIISVGWPFIRASGRLLGWWLRRKTRSRRQLILKRVAAEEEALQSKSSDKGSNTELEIRQDDWAGVIGFFHPFCNAGGGGERVLWAAIRATQTRYPRAVCVVYTGDHEATKTDILTRVKSRFNIDLHPPTVVFLYLSTRRYVLASTYPRFTLLGQSLGSLVLAYDALSLLVPDMLIDTMGYAFALAFARFCFPNIPTAAYVHYPTISTDMLYSLDGPIDPSQGRNAGAGRGWRGQAKKLYWRLFAIMYSAVGGQIDVVLTNSTWTHGHINDLWGPSRASQKKKYEIEVLYPPVAVEELVQAIVLDAAGEARREKLFIYVAQFRPEKNHALILRAFAHMLLTSNTAKGTRGAKLVLVGSVRDSEDATRVYELRLLAHELKIKAAVDFVCDASWAELQRWLGRASIGVNGMWNEHFGIGVVEYQAAGLISVVHDSGGPREDIVVDVDGEPTGYHASSVPEYARAFETALALSPADKLAMRRRARLSALRFTDSLFQRKWTVQIERLVGLYAEMGARYSWMPSSWLYTTSWLALVAVQLWNFVQARKYPA